MFPPGGYDQVMSDDHDLRFATPDEIADALVFALQYSGRKRVHHADEAMARITADRLVQHLEKCGFVLMKHAPAPAMSAMPARRLGPDP